MSRRREESGRSTDVRSDDVRPVELRLGNDSCDEAAHRARRKQIVSTLRRAEPR
jgi:hypothetical protein